MGIDSTLWHHDLSIPSVYRVWRREAGPGISGVYFHCHWFPVRSWKRSFFWKINTLSQNRCNKYLNVAIEAQLSENQLHVLKWDIIYVKGIHGISVRRHEHRVLQKKPGNFKICFLPKGFELSTYIGLIKLSIFWLYNTWEAKYPITVRFILLMLNYISKQSLFCFS